MPNIISDKTYFLEYSQQIGHKIPDLISRFDFSGQAVSFDYLTQSSAVYSSNIEGNSVDLNSFMNYRLSQEKFKAGKEIAEIEDLIEAYRLAQESPLNETNLLKCHTILSKTLLIKSKRGKYRVEPVGVFGKEGLVYLAVEPEFLKQEMTTFFAEIQQLLQETLSAEEVFYFAALVHLRFVHLHPFRDGNGRTARLLEKWFIAEKLGKQFWEIPSEKYYKDKQRHYYEAIHLGANFYTLNYDKCMNFLVMLPNCLGY
ncbi:MAG: Fic family protein [Odoribacteraceae bacterium]|jgi:Fic family protein|nr:Fic family protein [Odoribacteraceae bacterium]